MKAQPQRLPRLQAALPAAEEAWPGLCRRRFLVPVACPLPHCCLLRLLAPLLTLVPGAELAQQVDRGS